MKKLVLSLLVVAVATVFAWNGYAEEIKEKTTVKTQGDKTVETTKMKGGGIKAEEKVTTTPQGTMTEQKVKGKGSKVERTEVQTAQGMAGQTKVKVKDGTFKDIDVTWAYFQQGNDYIIEYDVKNVKDKELIQALKKYQVTPTQASLLKPGMHRIVSTSPYTAGDVQANFRQVIVRDLANAALKRMEK